ncbi:thioesterase [Taibaiella sp. KBW10]|uniref:hotdog fold thioesterase n=1 Tax=Taibaiella sp. KBW10 TaxID=2153357 RepID=UPI000F5B31EE|nr:hotdog fold thioesterase [Taibaiella sp. KBW10]RQO30205.1 thioesterase [Taibaiella sp. KBW10]
MTPEQAKEALMKNDAFSKWLDIRIEKVDSGYCKLQYTIRPEMLNGFGSVHGGILFSASDSALAFACNSHGILSVAMEVSISYTRPAFEGQVLTVEAQEINLGKTTGLYDIKTYNEEGKLICVFKGTVYRTGKEIT